MVALVEHLHGDLTGDAMLAREQLLFQSHRVHVLEESIAQIVVNLEECSDHRTREPFFNQFVKRHLPKVARRTSTTIINLPPHDSKMPRRSIRVIGQIRFIRMNLPSRWPDKRECNLR